MSIDFEKRKKFHPSEEQQKAIEKELDIFEKEISYNEIIDNIYVGNYRTASDAELLIKEGITHILNCANGLKNFFENDNISYESKFTNPRNYQSFTNFKNKIDYYFINLFIT